MDNYVTLTLDKYNELYDKAKKYDQDFTAALIRISEAFDNLIKTAKENNIESENNEVEKNNNETNVEEFKVGDKVQVQDLFNGYAIINRIYSDKTAHVNFINNNYIDCCYPLSELKKIEESEDK